MFNTLTLKTGRRRANDGLRVKDEDEQKIEDTETQ